MRLGIPSCSTLAAPLLAVLLGGCGDQSNWPMAGQNLHNTRHQADEKKIGPQNVGELDVLWSVETTGNILTTPHVVAGGLPYVTDNAGYLYKISNEGDVLWKRAISDYTGISDGVSRTTPVQTPYSMVFGDTNKAGGAWVIGIDSSQGTKRWARQIDPTPSAHVTQSPVFYEDCPGQTAKGCIYVGVASGQEALATTPGYPCCDFRGSFVALDAEQGEIVDQFYTTPPAGTNHRRPRDRFSGVGVWGSTPVVDTARRAIYFTTGNNYTAPDSVKQCVQECEGEATCLEQCMRLEPDNHVDSILALDLDTFDLKWSFQAIPYDAWTEACIDEQGYWNPENCPAPEGEDYDFGQGPMLVTTPGPELVVACAKSGYCFALEPDTGEVAWRTQVGPGGVLGGSEWGSATDGSKVYVAISNSLQQSWTLQGSENAGETITRGFWSALDAGSGEILWQTPEPYEPQETTFQGPMAPVTVANGVVYACTTTPGDHDMFALDAATGQFLWQFASGGTCNAGAAVVAGVVYWGSIEPGTHTKYATSQRASTQGPGRLFAFSLGGN